MTPACTAVASFYCANEHRWLSIHSLAAVFRLTGCGRSRIVSSTRRSDLGGIRGMRRCKGKVLSNVFDTTKKWKPYYFGKRTKLGVVQSIELVLILVNMVQWDDLKELVLFSCLCVFSCVGYIEKKLFH